MKKFILKVASFKLALMVILACGFVFNSLPSKAANVIYVDNILSPDKSEEISEISPDQVILGELSLDKPFNEYLKKGDYLIFDLRAKGGMPLGEYRQGTEDSGVFDLNTKEFTFRIFAPIDYKNQEPWPETYMFVSAFKVFLNAPEKHYVTLTMRTSTGTVLAEKDLTVDMTGQKADLMRDLIKQYEIKRASYETLPTPEINDPALEKEFFNAIKAAGVQVYKVVLTDGSWHVRHLENGAIQDKYMDVSFVTKGSDGCFITVARMVRQYNGSDYEKVFYAGAGFGDIRIDCSKVKP
jgi:hypothetical protein